ncbi:glucose-methanol-choline (GMC) oxidoreductase [Cladophialophora carrionii]|uniref:Glucose-methanol-choline (GMC) oxidoreductase n=1 Tax=Cladophialophora carrionii TaxID=86049 RepID=A0A1C1CQK9_9EURO|nr:glucose-methanol-choline (GMC) oxidoreductase [Cladophialophora carrionii]
MVHPATVPKDAPKTFDFIVVGGGTAGCVVAGRLAENPRVSVLVIEAGPNNTDEIPEISTPARAFELRGSKTTMIDRPDYTRVEKPNTRGKMLGGSSGGNYFTWVRGSAATFDDWAEYGTDEWNWENTKDYFNKSATYHDDEGLYPAALAKIGNQGGPLHISHSDLVPEIKPFRDALEKAWVSKGQELTTDVYSGVQKGLFKCVNSIYKGRRSTAAVFIEGKENVTLLSSTISKNLVLENGKAVGITVIGPDSREYTFNANYEVVVSQGVFESPKLLMLSGIGRKADLEALGIRPVVDSQHVGQNLLDHPILSHVFKMKDGYGLDSHLLRAGPEKDGAVAAYRKDRSGPYSSGLLELVAFPRADEWFNNSKEYREYKAKNGGVDPFGPGGQPHFEVDFVPMFSDAFQWHFPTPPQGDYLTVIVDLMRPLSRNGEVRLQSADPTEQPYINLNFFSHDLDLIALREGVRMIDDIVMHGDGLKDIIEGDYPWPMPRHSDEAMIRQILERSQTGFHPCGTLRLGKSIEQGVVDPQLRVYGTTGLRIIDASIFPIIPDCRIQNDVYMVAEKGADYIKAEYPELFKQAGKGEYDV